MLNLIPPLILLAGGCQAFNHQDVRLSYRDPATGIHVERGRPSQLIDGIGSVASIPSKLALWDRRADNHDVSKDTESALLQYMDHNQLNDTLVRVNQYDPLGEWKRLTANHRIHPGWRYTVGVYNGLKYTLLPGRILGGDWYNPFTDTTHIYSDLSPLAISRTAYAKDVRSQPLPGLYAASQEIPLLNMLHESRARQETLMYYRQVGDPYEQSEARRVIEPDYGGSWVAQVASILPYGAPLGRLVGAGVGHLTNRIRNSTHGANANQLTTHDPDACDSIGACNANSPLPRQLSTSSRPEMPPSLSP
ncbi:hypothetical protein [Crateriforma spongiae]|uniref:hypothetical protein n=1 Tax=Crateriforma spongiae TaxID=2724528 RepID=UPI0039AEA551